MKIVWDKVVVFTLSLLPLAYMVFRLLTDQLGANPVEALSHHTGLWAFRFVLLTLAITPLAKLAKWKRPLAFRRMIGLYAFFYALMHVVVWLLFDHGLDMPSAWDDIVGRPYLLLGFVGVLGLLALAITSPKAMVKKLGRRWKPLHRFIYPISVVVLLHFYLRFKVAPLEFWVHALILLLLLGYRVSWIRNRVHASKV